MSENDEPPDPEALERFREEHRAFVDEFDADIAATSEWLDQLVTLLAWLFRQIEDPRPIANPDNWPSVWLTDQPETREAAFLDPLLFDLARHQVAAVLEGKARRDIGPLQALELTAWAAALLRADRPGPGQGAEPGRAGVQLLVMAVRNEIRSWNLWRVREQRTDPHDPLTEFPTDPAIAAALSERLNLHPLLEDLQSAVPEPKDLRRLLPKA